MRCVNCPNDLVDSPCGDLICPVCQLLHDRDRSALGWLVQAGGAGGGVISHELVRKCHPPGPILPTFVAALLRAAATSTLDDSNQAILALMVQDVVDDAEYGTIPPPVGDC
jgi:hypothetical protein